MSKVDFKMLQKQASVMRFSLGFLLVSDGPCLGLLLTFKDMNGSGPATWRDVVLPWSQCLDGDT